MGREDILLKEYEVCQQDKYSSGTQYWAAFGVFFGINAIFLGWLVPSILSNSIPDTKGTLNWKVLVLVLGLATIFVNVILRKWLERVNYIVRIINHRMREIEIELGMRKNLIIHDLDDLDECRKRQDRKKTVLTELELREYYPPPTRGSKIVPMLFCLAIDVYMTLIIGAWTLIVPLVMPIAFILSVGVTILWYKGKRSKNLDHQTH